ncbi:MAG: hypothetical protein PSN34_13060, partial [Urechidicola sp.]|nr:hypothetical protein [Urechidicola sp.]
MLYEVYDLAVKIVQMALDKAEKKSHLNFYKLPEPILELILDVTVKAIKQENLFNFPEIDFSKELLLSEQIELKQQLEALDLKISDDEGMFAFWHSFENIIKHFVLSLETIARNDNADGGNVFNAELIHFTTDLNYHVERMIISFFGEKKAEMGLFAKNRRQFLINVDVVSGLGSNRTPQQQQEETDKVKLPTEVDLTGHELVDGYLKNTYLENIFSGTTQATIPLSLRFEHCHIIAGTGHGNSNTRSLSYTIAAGQSGGVVIDSAALKTALLAGITDTSN